MTVSQLIIRLVFLTAPLWLNDFYKFYLPKEADVLSEVLDVIIYVCWQTSIIYFAYQANWFDFSSIGLKNIDWRSEFKSGCIYLLLVLLIYLFLSAIVHYGEELLSGKTPPSGHPEPPKWNIYLVHLHLVYISLTAGFFEEFIYRGIIINQLEKKMTGKFRIVIVSSLIFVLIHWSSSYTIWVLSFLLGLLWAYLYLREKRMFALIFSHAVFDYLSFSGVLENFLYLFGITAI